MHTMLMPRAPTQLEHTTVPAMTGMNLILMSPLVPIILVSTTAYVLMVLKVKALKETVLKLMNAILLLALATAISMLFVIISLAHMSALASRVTTEMDSLATVLISTIVIWTVNRF